MKDEKIIKEIDRYITGGLSPKEIDELWARFLENPEYYRWFETELHLRKLAKDSKRGKVLKMEGRSSAKSYRHWILAAAAVLLVSFGLRFFLMESDDSIYSQALAKIDNLELVGADVYRSDDEVAGSLDVAINQGVAYAYNNEEERAINHFMEILTQSPTTAQQARIEMNLGILYYNRGEYSESVHYFKSVTELENLTLFFEEKAWWFLGNAYLNLRQLSEARDAVFNAYTLDGRYNSPALSLLKKLDLELGIIPPEPDEVQN
jgi:tetratricopeptide (TPR) repeat protein